MDLPTPTPITKPKLTGYDFFRSIGSPRHVLAPMVDASELPWRILSRAPIDGMPLDSSEKGKGRIKQEAATLAYTPMIHARLFSGDKYEVNVHGRGMFDLVCGAFIPFKPLCSNDDVNWFISSSSCYGVSLSKAKKAQRKFSRSGRFQIGRCSLRYVRQATTHPF